MKLPCIDCGTLVHIPDKYRRKGMKQSICYDCLCKREKQGTLEELS